MWFCHIAEEQAVRERLGHGGLGIIIFTSTILIRGSCL